MIVTESTSDLLQGHYQPFSTIKKMMEYNGEENTDEYILLCPGIFMSINQDTKAVYSEQPTNINYSSGSGNSNYGNHMCTRYIRIIG